MDNNLLAILIGLVTGTVTPLLVTALRTRAERLATAEKPKRKRTED